MAKGILVILRYLQVIGHINPEMVLFLKVSAGGSLNFS